MFSIVNRQRDELADVRRFVDMLNEKNDLFTEDADVFVARAPGRLDVMGGIADYSGSLVLQLPIAESTISAVQLNDSDTIRITSLDGESSGVRTFQFSTSTEPDTLASSFRGQWYGYIAGVFIVLQREIGFQFERGASIVVSSDIPIGKGVSSSAALEVSVMTAVCAAYGIELDSRSIALLCQKVENTIVGAACGIMDQMSVTFGVEGSLMSMVCQPAELGDQVPIPLNVGFAGIDSGVRHAVVGSDYASVRTAAFMGYRIIAHLAGLPVKNIAEGKVAIDDPRWNGYVANVTVRDYESEFESSIPGEITGRDFLAKYGGITDAATSVEPNKAYRVKASTEHAIYENDRIHRFGEILSGSVGETELEELGELMYATHASYARCGLTEPGTDRLVELARKYRDRSVYGARITGGGSGGTVAFLFDRQARNAIAELASEYGMDNYLFEGSSPGCASYDVVRLTRG